MHHLNACLDMTSLFSVFYRLLRLPMCRPLSIEKAFTTAYSP
jgi:hypothetical protein